MSSDSFDQDEISNEERNIQLFAKNMLQGRLFVGTFQEKRYVADLNSYRDVISVNREEKELIRDIEVVRKKIRGYTNKWLGITGPDIIGAPAGYCLWVELPQEVFGSYWYMIKTVRFRKNEIIVKLKQLRSATPIVEKTPSHKPRNTTSQDQKDGTRNTTQESDGFDVSVALETLKEQFIEKGSYLFENIITIKNTKDTVVFLSILIVTLFTGAVQLIQFLGEFSLKLMRELSILLKTATPIVIASINMIGRCIAGLYMLILMLFRESKTPSTQYKKYEAIQYTNPYMRALPGPQNPNRYRSGVVITPLD